MYSGWIIIIILAISVIRSFINKINKHKGEKELSEEKNTPSKKAFVLILALNVLFIAYSIIYYGFNISPETVIKNWLIGF